MDLLRQYPQLKIIQQMAKAKKLPIFLVGGFLRDHYLGHSGTDFDFAVKSNALSLAKQFARRIKGAFVLLDSEHGSSRVVKNEGGKTTTYDFTDFRGATIQADLKLRDFTINTLCLDLLDLKEGDSLESKIMDEHQARLELKKKKVCMVSAHAFVDDPLRILRAYSLQATWDLNIEAKTLAQMKKNKNLITNVSMERVRDEIFKVLNSPRAYENLTAMDKMGLLPKVMPQISIMYDVPQGGYHHLDVWKHSLEVVHQLEILLDKEKKTEAITNYLNEEIGGAHTRESLLKMAALLHDIGKPETRKLEGNRITFHGHEHVGENITRIVAKHLKLSVKERYFLENVVRAHLRPGYLSNFKRPSDKAVFRYFRDTAEEATSIAFLGLADQAATCGPLTTAAKSKHHANICRMLIDRFFEVKKEAKPKVRLLTGQDLIKKLKLKPSPIFGKILEAVEEAHALGKVSTKAEALDLARTLA